MSRVKTKTSLLVDPQLWQRFKKEVEKRFKGRRASVPPVSNVVEDLIRGWLEGLHRIRIPVYEAAYIAGLEPKILLLYARVNPELAFRIFQARPSAFLDVIATDFTPRSPDKADKRYQYYYVVKEDRANIYYYEYYYDEWFEGGDTWYFITRNKGAPYFNALSLETLLGEGYPEAVAARHLGVEEICIATYVTFSLKDPEGWRRLLAILSDLIESSTRPAKTYIKSRDCDAYRLTREAMAASEEHRNALRFLELLSNWIPSNLTGQSL